jgi:F-type H+-transporting ATPase subunit b
MPPLLTPGTGLIIWQVIIFAILFFMLKKLAWKPILQSLKIREESIQDALNAADMAREEMAKLQADNQKLLEEARLERDKIIKEAREAGNRLVEEAKAEASRSAAKLMEDARAAINTEKHAALAEIKTQVALLSLQVAEKLLRKNLESDKAQKELIGEFMKELNLN